MDNNINLTSRGKKKGRKRRNSYPVRHPQPQPIVGPAATLQGLKTIANFLQIHQQLNLARTRPALNNSEPQPLMSRPRLAKPPMFTRNNIPLGTQIMQFPFAGSSGLHNSQLNARNVTINANLHIGQNNTSGSENFNTKQSQNIRNNQNTNIQTKIAAIQNVNKPKVATNNSATPATEKTIPIKSEPEKFFKNNQPFKQETNFYNSVLHSKPLFVNSGAREEIDLNDDDLNGLSENDKNSQTIKQNIPVNFHSKFQDQNAKKFEMKNVTETKSIPVSENITVKLTQQTGQDESKKMANNELIEGLTSDIKTVIKDNIPNMNCQRSVNYPVQSDRYPKGIPRSFLHQQNKIPGMTLNEDSCQRSFKSTPLQNAQASEIFVQTDNNTDEPQLYSPSDICQDTIINDTKDGSESPDVLESGQKRVSAFQRLGPLSQPKKPKLTINLCVDKEQATREVVDETSKDVPVHDREDINNSTDETVQKYLPFWPWKKKVSIRKKVTARTSKTVMMMEKEQMEEIYMNDNILIMLSIKGYPPSWTKENVMDTLLENLKGKIFIPFFIEFSTKECKFFVIRSREALLSIHWLGFSVRRDNVILNITISPTYLTIRHIDFVPRLVLRRQLAKKCYGSKLDLSEFTLKSDISHFIYFPLNREFNQTVLVQTQSVVAWQNLTELNLSNNRITSLDGFGLPTTTPHLKILNLSNNCVERALHLLPLKALPLKQLFLEGNPLCYDYIDCEQYIKVVRMIFSSLRELDGIPITLKGDLPKFKKNYCPKDAEVIVEKFLETFFPLLDANKYDRQLILNMYASDACMTITYMNSLRYEPLYKSARNLLIKRQDILKGDLNGVEGVTNIGKLIQKWPLLHHYSTKFTIDVMYYDESSLIFKVAGVLKVTPESLTEKDALIAFSRTFYLYTDNDYEYKIGNEMIFWSEPTREYSTTAFQTVTIPKKPLNLKFESDPDENIKKKLISIFMSLTELEEKQSERCLEKEEWHLQRALEHFLTLLKVNNLEELNE